MAEQSSPENFKELVSLWMNQRPQDVQGGSVPLHILCKRCERIADDPLMNHIQNWTEVEQTSLYKLGTVSELYEARTCHLCQLILGACCTSRTEISSRARLYFEWSWYHDHITGNTYSEKPSYVDGECVSVRILTVTMRAIKPQDVHSVMRLPPALQWSSIPLLAKDNLGVLKQWLQECLDHHEECHELQRKTVLHGNQRPTRILDLSNDMVRLRCNVETEKGIEYITLSHMWGRDPSQQLRLVTAKLAQFQEEISLRQIPPIYQEAIRITQSLGYRYLWIDSLCIIQDSKEDWEAEATKMAAVYGNSACTLFHLLPPQFEIPLDSGTRMQRGDPRQWAPCILSPPTDQRPAIYACRFRYGWQCEWASQFDWPLFTRAWVFQERVLSTRKVYFGLGALMWECADGFCDELLGKREFKGPELGMAYIGPDANLRQFSLERVIFKAGGLDPDIRKIITAWGDMVDHYRSKKLTKASDRTIAFAGVARTFHDLHGGTYLAGLWKELLHFNLLWYIDQIPNPPLPPALLLKAYEKFHEKSEETCEPGTQNAPTWSWFSVPPWYTLRWSVWLKFMRVDETVFMSPAKIISVELVSGSSNQRQDLDNTPHFSLYDFSGLRITLKCLTLAGQFFSAEKDVIELRVPALTSTLQNSLDLKFVYYHDAFEAINYKLDHNGTQPGRWTTFTTNKKLPADVVLANITEYAYNAGFRKGPVIQTACGLALVPSSEGEGIWRRVGMWKLTATLSTIERVDDVENVSLFHRRLDCREQTMTIV